MDIRDWFSKIINEGQLCQEYTDKYEESKSKKQLVDLALGGRGITYLCEMKAKGYGAPYDVLQTQFAPFINGKYVYGGTEETPYTSCIYVKYDDGIQVSTTAVVLLACKSKIVVPQYRSVHLFVDADCDISIECPKGSVCYVDYWGDATINYSNDEGKVLVKRK